MERLEAAPYNLPAPVVRYGRRFLGWAQKQFYNGVMDTDVEGREHIPADGRFLVAANHASHLDAGLAKIALGPAGRQMAALAARDYFFNSRLARTYFENFTNLLALERHGALKTSLKRAIAALESGQPLLIFPEGTRTPDGQMRPFKPAIGFLSLAAQQPVLPMYLWGTYEAMPKGSLMVPTARRIGVSIGPAIPVDLITELTAGRRKQEVYRIASLCVEVAVHALRERNPLAPEQIREHVLETLEHPADAAQRRVG
jgi:long-chain acyl-CoA synthetase